MIKASELRIGNYLNVRLRTFSEFKKEKITASGIMDIHSNKDKSSIEYQPIPLTEEILLKCGWVQEKSKYTSKLGNSMFLLLDVFYDGEDFYLECLGVRKHLTSLHYLQNLVHSLTNKELEITM